MTDLSDLKSLKEQLKYWQTRCMNVEKVVHDKLAEVVGESEPESSKALSSPSTKEPTSTSKKSPGITARDD